MKKRNYGYQPDKKDKRDFKFGDGQLAGRLGGDEIINPTGDYGDYLPIFEPQSKNFDTMNCWVFGTLNSLETLHKFQYGEEKNWSDREVNIGAGGTTNGGQPRNAIEFAKNKGLIPEEMLPFSDDLKNWWQYHSPDPLTQNYLNEGIRWLKNYSVGYEYVKTQYGWVQKFKNLFRGNNRDIIVEALKRSPLGVSVLAWQFRNGLAYKYSYQSDNHWIMLYGFEYGKYWKLYDHYNNMFIKAEWNYPFGFIIRYSLIKKNESEVNMEQGQKLYERLKNTYIIRAEANGELYLVKQSKLEYCALYISEPIMKEEFNRYLRSKKNFIGISETDFKQLSDYIVSIGGGVDQPIDIEKILKNNS